MNDLYFKVLTHAENALVCGKNMREILSTWLDGTTNAEHDERDANLAGALITLLDPVIKELDEAIKIHNQSYTGE